MRTSISDRRAAAAVLGVLVSCGSAAHAQQLPDTIAPRHYALELMVDPAASAFTGTEIIRIEVLSAASDVVLNAADLTLTRVTARQDGRTQEPQISTDAAAERVALHFANPLRRGQAEIAIEYRGPIRTDLRGLYLSEAAGRRYAVTQFEPTDARRMFPSFDEPDKKATFALTAVVPAGLTAISNAPIVSERTAPNGRHKTVQFATTPPMSPYLVALAVGSFTCVAESAAVPLRVCAVPESAHLTRFALDTAASLLRFFNRYFAIDYPFKKLDLLAIPDFAAGAMENTGAIFFRESLLLIDPATASLATKKRAATVIAHEMAHQWFGDLVTMKWWDDLWLNEGFATWMETKAADAIHPEWQLPLDALQDREAAMNVDSLTATRAVKSAARTPEQINQLFDPIAYEKGGAILRMVEAYLGEEGFRTGINAYLAQHRYGNATSEQFWRALSDSSGAPVDRIVSSYVTQPGMPAVQVNTECHDGSADLLMSQTRVSIPGAAPDPGDALWTIPVCLHFPAGSATRIGRCVVVATPEWRVPTAAPCGSWLYANANQDAYYRTTYADDLLERLTERLPELTPRERLGLSLDVWSDVRSGAHAVGAYLGVARALASDSATIVSATASRVRWIEEYLANGDTRRRFDGWMRDLYTSALATVGADVPAAETARRRAALVLTLGAAGDGTVIAEARRQVDHYLAHPAASRLDAALLDAYTSVAAQHGDQHLYDRYIAALPTLGTPAARDRLLYALADFQDPGLVARTIDYAIGPAVRSQDAALLTAAVFDTPNGRDVAWPIVRKRWTEIERKVGGFAGTARIIEALGAYCDAQHARDIRSFFNAHPAPEASRSLTLALERIELCTVLRGRETEHLQEWLARDRRETNQPGRIR